MRTQLIGMATMALIAGTALGQDALQGKSAAEVLKAEEAHLPSSEFTLPKLMPGDAAPELKIASWVKGAPISEFEDGTVYMVDFWATWCGPCIRAMPHMTKLQEKYNDDNFRLIGVSIWEQQEGDELIEHVSSWVEKNDEKMGYTVAIDDDGQMAESWMTTSGQRGIPTAMLVDREGEIAWIGYGNDPALDGALEQVINGSWDNNVAREARAEMLKSEATEVSPQQKWFQHFRSLAEDGDRERATMVAAAAFEEGIFNDPGALNSVAWTIVENEGWGTEAATVARDMAAKAIDQVGDNAAVLDTLAWAHFRLGEIDSAIEVQKKAVANAEGEMKADLEKSLETFKAAKD